MRSLIASFLRPGVIFPVPGGIVADKVGEWGLFGFMHNANMYAASMASYSTASAPTLLAADVRKGVIQLNTGASAGFAVTLPSTNDLLTAFSAKTTLPLSGNFWKPIFIVNNSVGQTATLTAADAMTTINGTATVATAVTRFFMMRVLDSTIQFTNCGALTL